MIPSILFVAGKSGGHIIPALTLAQQAYDRDRTHISFIAQNTPLDISLIRPHAWISNDALLSIPTIQRRRWSHYPWYIVQLCWAFIKALWLLIRWRPDQIISMGGLISIPVCYAGRLLGIPYSIYELNSELGAAVSWLQQGATQVRCCSTRALQELQKDTRGVITPYPLRSSIMKPYTIATARTLLGVYTDKLTLCIVGGSQGSQGLNRLIMDWINGISTDMLSSLQIIHQTGPADVDLVTHYYAEKNVAATVFVYHSAIEECYQAADIFITRAGAGALHEIGLFARPTIVVPLITRGTAHQRSNAAEFVSKQPELWYMVEQADTILFKETVTRLMQRVAQVPGAQNDRLRQEQVCDQ